ncbi:MAG: thioredoxin domain-containing protein [bacterium]
MPNRLADETSPYLLQHRDNPVDWWPWCEGALSLAKRDDKPILLSIGYSACHWCHVMERESFEDPKTAAEMNRDFVCIKVDREERPDVDAIYMEAVQAMTGQGGWPLTAFCDPSGVPFYGGTYFPPEPRQGMPSFRQVLAAVIEGFRERREEIDASVSQIRERLGVTAQIADTGQEISPGTTDAAEANLLASADRQHGGFGGAPKFPPASALAFLLDRGETDVTTQTLDAMLCGGIFDQLGGGFARYAVDQRWLVPHFEKMLYDNALLARCYLSGWKRTGRESWADATKRTLDWALAEMLGEEGGFYSALDADSEGKEGTFYIWSEDEMREVLETGGLSDIEVEQTLGYWGVSASGNFEGKNILHIAAGPSASPPDCLERARELLLTARAKRIRPGLDDKRLCAWNALMISALADAGAAFQDERYLHASIASARFVLDEMRTEEGRLLRTWKEGKASLNAYLEDYAFMLEAMLDLHAASLDPCWFDEARALADLIIEHFEDSESGGFFTTSHDHEELLVRRKALDDHPLPSATSSAALGMLRLSLLTGSDRYRRAALRAISPLAEIAASNANGFGHLLQAIDLASTNETRELAIVYPSKDQSRTFPGGSVAATAARYPLARTVVGGGPEGSEYPELLEGRTCLGDRPTAYLCENFSCRQPVDRPEELQDQLEAS